MGTTSNVVKYEEDSWEPRVNRSESASDTMLRAVNSSGL
jgi:hypothetical protein